MRFQPQVETGIDGRKYALNIDHPGLVSSIVMGEVGKEGVENKRWTLKRKKRLRGCERRKRRG